VVVVVAGVRVEEAEEGDFADEAGDDEKGDDFVPNIFLGPFGDIKAVVVIVEFFFSPAFTVEVEILNCGCCFVAPIPLTLAEADTTLLDKEAFNKLSWDEFLLPLPPPLLTLRTSRNVGLLLPIPNPTKLALDPFGLALGLGGTGLPLGLLRGIGLALGLALIGVPHGLLLGEGVGKGKSIDSSSSSTSKMGEERTGIGIWMFEEVRVVDGEDGVVAEVVGGKYEDDDCLCCGWRGDEGEGVDAERCFCGARGPLGKPDDAE